MSDVLNENGLTVKTANEIREELVNGFKAIYGADLILDSNTSDGQIIDIFTQAGADIRELILEVYNSCNPDLCRGQVQDVRFRINNLFRKGGTFTIVPITLEITQTVTLQGLDSDYNDVTASAYGFTDDSGEKYYLIDTVTLTAGTYVKPFRASKLGNIQPVLNTITNPITIVKGVKSGTNNSAPTSYGTEQETDIEFATRRQRSTSLRGQNSIDGLVAQLLDLDGVTQAFVYQNNTDTTDDDGIPPHYIWVIVEGGSNAEISSLIYSNIGGAGCKGDVEVDVPTASGQTFKARFDRTIAIPLYIKFDLQETVKNTIFDIEGIKEYIAENLIYEIDELAETSKPTEISRLAIDTKGGGGVPANLEISTDGITWTTYIPSASKQNIFTVDTSRISITEINI